MTHETSTPRDSVRVRLPATLTVGATVVDVTACTVGTEGARVLLDGGDSRAFSTGTTATLSIGLPRGAGRVHLDTEIRRLKAATDHRGRSCAEMDVAYRDVSPEARQALQDFAARTRPLVLVVGGADAISSGALVNSLELEVAPETLAAWTVFDRDEVAVAVLGAELRGEAARAFLSETKERFPALVTRFVVLAAGREPSLFQPFVDDDTIFFLTESPVAPEEMHAIVRSAAASWLHSVRGPRDAVLESAEQISRARRILDLAQRLAVQNETDAVAALAGAAVRDLASADRAYCLLYDARQHLLRSRGPEGAQRSESAAAGLVSFVARTGLPLRLAHAAADGRYDRDADDSEGGGDERLLALSVPDDEGRVLAVLVAVRSASRAEFEQADAETLAQLARHVGSVLGRLTRHEELERAAADTGTSLGRSVTDVYREEALRHHVSRGERGDVLRVSGRWMTWTYWVIALSLMGGFLFVSLASVHEYAAGLAVVRLDGRVDVTTTVAGTISQVDVQPGALVTTGQVLVRLNDAEEAADSTASTVSSICISSRDCATRPTRLRGRRSRASAPRRCWRRRAARSGSSVRPATVSSATSACVPVSASPSVTVW